MKSYVTIWFNWAVCERDAQSKLENFTYAAERMDATGIRRLFNLLTTKAFQA